MSWIERGMALVGALVLSLLLPAVQASAAEDEIVIVGGSGVVSDGLADHLGSCTNGTVERLAGADRYATAAAIATRWSSADTVFLATGLDFGCHRRRSRGRPGRRPAPPHPPPGVAAGHERRAESPGTRQGRPARWTGRHLVRDRGRSPGAVPGGDPPGRRRPLRDRRLRFRLVFRVGGRRCLRRHRRRVRGCPGGRPPGRPGRGSAAPGRQGPCAARHAAGAGPVGASEDRDRRECRCDRRGGGGPAGRTGVGRGRSGRRPRPLCNGGRPGRRGPRFPDVCRHRGGLRRRPGRHPPHRWRTDPSRLRPSTSPGHRRSDRLPSRGALSGLVPALPAGGVGETNHLLQFRSEGLAGRRARATGRYLSGLWPAGRPLLGHLLGVLQVGRRLGLLRRHHHEAHGAFRAPLHLGQPPGLRVPLHPPLPER